PRRPQTIVPNSILSSPPGSSPFDYLVVILMENKGFNSINGNAAYLNQLASSYSLATRYTAVNHPSLPNYLALSGADTFGCGGYDGAPNSNSCNATASNFMWLTPNLCNDMHDCSVAIGDNYLSQVVPKILRSNIFQTQKAALMITFDEGTATSPSDLVYTVWAGPVVKRGYQSSVAYSHYSVARTIESAWNLTTLTTNDASATAMTEFFTSPQQSALQASFSMSGNNVRTALGITFTGTANGGSPPYFYNWYLRERNTGMGCSIVYAYQA